MTEKRGVLLALLPVRPQIFLCFHGADPLPCPASPLPREEDAEGLLDEEELSSLLPPYLEKYGATEENFSLAFTYTGTGESYYLNGDKAFYGASLYKVPLCMIFAETAALRGRRGK